MKKGGKLYSRGKEKVLESTGTLLDWEGWVVDGAMEGLRVVLDSVTEGGSDVDIVAWWAEVGERKIESSTLEIAVLQPYVVSARKQGCYRTSTSKYLHGDLICLMVQGRPRSLFQRHVIP